MKNWYRSALAFSFGLICTHSALAETPITTFDDFTSGALYASWLDATIDSGPEAYSITAKGYGSNWKFISVDATGETTLRLTVTLSTVVAHPGKLGPIVTLVDGDGTRQSYAWYGRVNGTHNLSMPVRGPTSIDAAGSTPGLNLATLSHLHVGIDPGDFKDFYTVSWQDLRLTGAPPMAITASSFNAVTREFSLNWRSKAGKLYTVLHALTLGDTFNALLADIESGGTTTQTTVTMPEGVSGYLRIVEQ